jgi:hypothetical protein
VQLSESANDSVDHRPRRSDGVDSGVVVQLAIPVAVAGAGVGWLASKIIRGRIISTESFKDQVGLALLTLGGALVISWYGSLISETLLPVAQIGKLNARLGTHQHPHPKYIERLYVEDSATGKIH